MWKSYREKDIFIPHCGALWRTNILPETFNPTLIPHSHEILYSLKKKTRQKTKVMLYFVKLENNGSYKKYCLTTFVSIHQQQV